MPVLLWVITTPFGAPVLPEVYMMTARSSGLGGVGGMFFSLPKASSSGREIVLSDGTIFAAFGSLSTKITVLKDQHNAQSMSYLRVGQLLQILFTVGRRSAEVKRISIPH